MIRNGNSLLTARAEVTRFAPSPSGHLHLGHAYSALFAARRAQASGGRFLLRIEDIDRARCRDDYEAAIYEDLDWLGLTWETPVLRQSDHIDGYRAALARLRDDALIYPCFCTRGQIAAEIERAGQAPHGPEGPLYPGTCRRLSDDERTLRLAEGAVHAWRLDMARAYEAVGRLTFVEESNDERETAVTAGPLGDVVLARKDIGTSYHLAVTLDDAQQGITLVTRGRDLMSATPLHRLLQELLDLPVPRWHHHKLVTDDKGQRLAKRHDALSLRSLRAAGKSPAEVRALAGFPD